MSEMLAKIADSTAQRYQARAAKATDPTKREKLLAKAEGARHNAAVQRRVRASVSAPSVPPRTGPLPGQGPPPMDAPTVWFHPVGPGQAPAPQPPPGGWSWGKKIGVGVVGGFVLLGVLGMLGGGADDGDSESAVASGFGAATGSQYSAADRQACETTGDALREVGDIDTSGVVAGGHSDIASDTLIQAERVQGAAVAAEDADLSGAIQDTTAVLREVGGAVSAMNLPRLERVAGDMEETFPAVVAACAPVLAES